MANIITLTSLDAPELDVYARLTQAQLRNRLDPQKGLFEYSEERVKLAGGQRNLFSPQAIRAIHNTSHGVMRLINGIASGSLTKAWRIQAPMVESEQITSLISDK